MSNARNLADIVTGNFDVPLGALDNVPPSNDASALTTGTLPVGRLPSSGVDASSLTTGTLVTARLPAGSVIQVVQAYRTSFISTTSSSLVDVLTTTITPQSSSSIFLIMCTGIEATYNGDGNSYSIHQIERNGSNVYIGDDAGTNRGSSGRYGRQGSNLADTVAFNYVDSPNTASAITYKWRFASTRGPSWTVSLGGTPTTSFSGHVRSPTSMIIMEIA